MNEQQAIEHDAGVFENRAYIQKYMLAVELLVRMFGGEPSAKALAVTVADEYGLWDGDDLPQWVMDAAEWAVGEADRIGEREDDV